MMLDEIEVTVPAFIECDVVPGYRESNGQGEPEHVKEMKVFVYASFRAIRNAYLANQMKGPNDLCNVDIFAGLSESEKDSLENELIAASRNLEEIV